MEKNKEMGNRKSWRGGEGEKRKEGEGRGGEGPEGEGNNGRFNLKPSSIHYIHIILTIIRSFAFHQNPFYALR